MGMRITCVKNLIVQLNGHSIPGGMVSLEKIFDLDDVAREPQLVPNCEYVEEVNIGIEEQPKIIKIARILSPESK